MADLSSRGVERINAIYGELGIRGLLSYVKKILFHLLDKEFQVSGKITVYELSVSCSYLLQKKASIKYSLQHTTIQYNGSTITANLYFDIPL